MTKILNRHTGAVMFEDDNLTIKELVVENKDNLHGADLRGAALYDADLYDANFGDANLEDVDLRGADLFDANFGDAILEGAKFDDEIEALKKHRTKSFKKKLAKAALKRDALDMNNWHSCETTHCLAGWASVLSDSLELERDYPVHLIGWACLGDDWAKMFYSSDETAAEFLTEYLQEND